jgi:hypothetical protein
MADAAGVYEALWRPDEHGWEFAKDITATLERGLSRLKADKALYETFNPENGWGSYEGRLYS